MTDLNRLRQNFTSLRKRDGLSLHTLAKKLDVSYATLLRFEHGEPAIKGFSIATTHAIQNWVNTTAKPVRGRIADLDNCYKIVNEVQQKVNALHSTLSQLVA